MLDDGLVGIANDYDISIAYQTYATTQAAMGLRETSTISATQKFGYRIAGRELSILPDGFNKRARKIEYGNKKGYLTKDFGNQFETTYKMAAYLRNQQTLTGASDDVKQEYIQIIQDSKDLNLGRMETMTIEMVALYTQGWVDTAIAGPGSPTPNLNPLYFNAHVILGTGGTFSNVLSTPDQVLTNVTLQEALDILKTGVKLQNGKFVKQGAGTFYKLQVGTVLAVTAREILNTYGKQATMYAGAYGTNGTNTASSNANQYNKFYFEGNLVEVVELPNLGDIVELDYGYGPTLGLQTEWHVTNPFVVNTQQALRKFEDYAPVMKNYNVPSNDNYVVDIRANVGVDHYYAECGTVGSRGTTP